MFRLHIHDDADDDIDEHCTENDHTDIHIQRLVIFSDVGMLFLCQNDILPAEFTEQIPLQYRVHEVNLAT